MQGVQNFFPTPIQPKPITFRESAYAISFLDLSPINLNRFLKIIFLQDDGLQQEIFGKFWIFFGDSSPETRIIL